MTHLLEMPNDVLGAVVAQCGLVGQAKLACVSRQLRQAVDTFHRDTGLQRINDSGRAFREAIPTVSELMIGEGDRFVTAQELRGALATYDRLCPEAPEAPEGALHQWYREAATMLETRDEQRARGNLCLSLGAYTTYVGGVALPPWQEESFFNWPQGFGVMMLDFGDIGRYLGNWKDGMRHGVGLIEWRSPMRAVFHGHFVRERHTTLGVAAAGSRTDYNSESGSDLWFRLRGSATLTEQELSLEEDSSNPYENKSRRAWADALYAKVDALEERKALPQFAAVRLTSVAKSWRAEPVDGSPSLVPRELPEQHRSPPPSP